MSSLTPYAAVSAATEYLEHQVIGQQHLVQRILITLLCGGHLLVEGAPGLAKTRAIKALAQVVEGEFHRIQFTPDLLPSDVTGTEIYRPEDGSFAFQQGPVFHNLILADEINRAPAKVQSALLEAMAEGCCCLAADCPHGPADLLRHNNDGLLLPRQATATRWSEAIDRLLQDPQQRQRLEGEAATVRERFSDRALEAQLMQALGQLD